MRFSISLLLALALMPAAGPVEAQNAPLHTVSLFSADEPAEPFLRG
jgi:hypothetical protein